MYLYFTEDELNEIFTNTLKDFQNNEEHVKTIHINLPFYRDYFYLEYSNGTCRKSINSSKILTVEEGIFILAKAYDVYTFIYNNSKIFRNHYLEPHHTTMLKELSEYCDQYINNSDISERAKNIMKLSNIIVKLKK